MDAPNFRIGLFGLYSVGNFGDDLMAVIFGRSLQELRFEFTVYGLPAEQEQHGYSITLSLQEFVDTSDMIVYGGGGILQPKEKDALFGQQLETLLHLCRQQSKPIFCFSIGGQGLPLASIAPPARRHLVEQAEYVTLRLRADLPLLDEAGTRGTHYEDVVWTTPSHFPPASDAMGHDRRPRIGINLYPHSAREKRLLPGLCHLLVRARRNCEFVFLESMFGESESYGGYRAFSPSRLRSNCTHYRFLSVDDGIKCVQNLDLLITNRLHLGMVAMSYGIPSIALSPLPKTRLCYQELGLGDLCWDIGQFWKIYQLRSSDAQGKLLCSFERFDLKAVRRSAARHLNKLEEIVRQCSRNRTSTPERSIPEITG